MALPRAHAKVVASAGPAPRASASRCPLAPILRGTEDARGLVAGPGAEALFDRDVAFRRLRGQAPGFRSRVFVQDWTFLTGRKALQWLSEIEEDTLPNYPQSFRDMVGPKAALVSSGAWHKHMYKVISAGLTVKQEDVDHFHIICKEALEEMTEITKQDGCVLAEPIMRKLTYRAVVTKVFGKHSDFDEYFEELLAVTDGMIAIFPFEKYLPWCAYYKGIEARKKLADGIQKVIDKVRESEVPSNAETSSDIISTLVFGVDEAGLPLTDSAIIDNVIALLIGGFDNTFSTMGWLFFTLAEEEEWLNKLAAEFSNSRVGDAPPTRGDVSNWKVGDMVSKEVLRMHSAVGALFRKAGKELKFNGWTIPKGSPMYISSRGAHLLDNEHGSGFHPERFDPALNAGSDPAYFPFGNGPRICSGRHIVYFLMKVMLFNAVPEYRWEVVDMGEFRKFPIPSYPYLKIKMVRANPEQIGSVDQALASI